MFHTGFLQIDPMDGGEGPSRVEPSYTLKFTLLPTDGTILIIGLPQLAVFGTFKFPFSNGWGASPWGREGFDIALLPPGH